LKESGCGVNINLIMRQIFLTQTETILLDIVIWVIIHLSIGYWTSRIPANVFNPESALFRTRKWEKDGMFYEKYFRVKAWKDHLPSGAALYEDAYEVKHIGDYSTENLRTWILESCRSEFCHYLMIIPGFFFFLWNTVNVGWIMVAYAFANNIIPIIMQRYNRPRVKKLLRYMERSKKYSRQQTVSSGEALAI